MPEQQTLDIDAWKQMAGSDNPLVRNFPPVNNMAFVMPKSSNQKTD
jgi:hypothetical protein